MACVWRLFEFNTNLWSSEGRHDFSQFFVQINLFTIFPWLAEERPYCRVRRLPDERKFDWLVCVSVRWTQLLPIGEWLIFSGTTNFSLGTRDCDVSSNNPKSSFWVKTVFSEKDLFQIVFFEKRSFLKFFKSSSLKKIFFKSSSLKKIFFKDSSFEIVLNPGYQQSSRPGSLPFCPRG